jgi:putative transposase
MTYNSEIHHRRSIRLKGYDYTRPGDYFITICTYKQECRFGRIVEALPGDAVTPDGRHIRFAETGTLACAKAASFEMRDPKINDIDAGSACIELNELGQIAFDEWLKLPQRFPNCQLGVFQIMPNHMHGIIELVDAPVGTSLADAPVSNASVSNVPMVGASLADAPVVWTSLADVPVPVANAPLSNAPMVGTSLADVPMPDDWYNEKRSDGRRDESAAEGGARAARAAMENKGATARVARTGDVVGAYKSLVFNGCLEVFKARDERMGKLWHRNYYEHIIRNEESYERISNYIINNPRRWKEDRFFL